MLEPARFERQIWLRALECAQQLGTVDADCLQAAREQLAARSDAELSPRLLAFWLDLSEELLVRLYALAQVIPGDAQLSACPADATQTWLSAAELPLRLAPGLRPGTVLDGYELLELLGSGGMGTVYRARELALRREVALKLLRWDSRDAQAERRFLREARAAAAVEDPYVVGCYAVGRSQGCYYVAMQLVEGGDVGGLLAEQPWLSERRALELVRDACIGLQAIERAGLIHRDIKPSNLLLAGDGRVLLGDFGLARSLLGDDRLTRSGVVVGTPAYMAPEQAFAAQDLDIRADIYGLGATLYHLVTGQAPFSGSTYAVIAAKKRPPLPARRVRPELSRELAALIGRAMDPRPAGRFAGPGPMRAAVERLLAGGAAAATTLASAVAEAAPAERKQESPRGPRAPRVAAPPNARQAVTSRESVRGADASPVVEPASPVRARVWWASLLLAGLACAALLRGCGARHSAETRAPERSGRAPVVAESSAVQSQADTPQPLMRSVDSARCFYQDGRYQTRLADRDFDRVCLLDRAARRLPLRVVWSVEAEIVRDSGPASDWERANGFGAPAGFFVEVGIRTENTPVEAAAELAGAAFWLCLQFDSRGGLFGLVRALNHDKQRGSHSLELDGEPLVGVARLQSFQAVRRPGLPVEVVLDCGLATFELQLRQAGTLLHTLRGRWQDIMGAPLDADLQGDIFLWSYLGHWADGRGRGSLQVAWEAAE